MTSTAGSPRPLARPIAKAAVVTHGQPKQIGAGLARLQAVAAEHDVELLFSLEEAEKHGLEPTADESAVDIAVGLGGGGTGVGGGAPSRMSWGPAGRGGAGSSSGSPSAARSSAASRATGSSARH